MCLRISTLLAGILLLPAVGLATPPRVGGVTGAVRGLGRALPEVFAELCASGKGQVEVLFLVDPSPALVKAEFAARLLTCVESLGKARRRIRVGLAGVGRERPVVIKPTLQHAHLTAKAHRLMAEAKDRECNVFADIRKVVGVFSGGRVRRHLVLVSLENGYLEDDLEATVASLRKREVVLTAITGEAFLADIWCEGRRFEGHPTCKGWGGDAPWVDLPGRWLFQETVANESIPAGVSLYALSRLAAVSGGKVWLHGSVTAARHHCSAHSGCPFCSGDHMPRGRAYSQVVVGGYSPLSCSRQDAKKAMLADPLGKVHLQVWWRAYQAGLLASRPPFPPDVYGEEPPEEKRKAITLPASAHALAGLVRRSGVSRSAADGLLALLQVARAKHGAQADSRIRAVVDLSLLHLRLVRLNLLGFAAWYREEAKRQFDPLYQPELPERRVLALPLPGPVFVGTRSLTLCHGAGPLLQVHLPGGEPLRQELQTFGREFESFVSTYQGTPYAAAAWRMGVATFQLYCKGRKASGQSRRPPRASKVDTPGTPKNRRPPRPGSRVDPGPSTGGRR